MRKRVLSVILILLVSGGGGVIYKSHLTTGKERDPLSKVRSAPVPVTLTNAMIRSIPVEVSTFGTVEPTSTVLVKSQITGILAKVLFAEGQEVRAGDLLFELDALSAQANLKQAEAVLAKDRVQLENAIKTATRLDVLQKKGFVALDVRDEAVTASETLKAQVQSDEAVVDIARLKLGYCSIRAPVSGRTGNLQVHQGNLIRENETPLVTINQLQPILVRFVLPQRELPRIRARVEKEGVLVIALPDAVGARAETGTVSFVDNTIDEKTGTILMKAYFANSRNALWPGQFVKVVLQLALQERALVIPETAVLLGQQGAYVYVADPSGKVMPRQVVVDRSLAGLTVISSGLEAGEEIVVEGQLRLKPGSRVMSRAQTSLEPMRAGRP